MSSSYILLAIVSVFIISVGLSLILAGFFSDNDDCDDCHM